MNHRFLYLYIAVILCLMTSCDVSCFGSGADEYVSPHVPEINMPQQRPMPDTPINVMPDPPVNGVNICDFTDEQAGKENMRCMVPWFPACMEDQDVPLAQAMFEGIAQSALIGGIMSTHHRLTYDGLPRNTRQVAEGYWIGSRPDKDQILELYYRKVRLVITAATMTPAQFRDMTRMMAKLGMIHVNIPFGGRFPSPMRFMGQVNMFNPDQIFIHCEHGGDRSGAILAYILVVRHGWSIARALLSVIIPSENNARALLTLLKQRNIEVGENDVNDVLGIYSAESTNGFGGLKLRSDGSYFRLVNTTIDAIQRTTNHR